VRKRTFAKHGWRGKNQAGINGANFRCPEEGGGKATGRAKKATKREPGKLSAEEVPGVVQKKRKTAQPREKRRNFAKGLQGAILRRAGNV